MINCLKQAVQFGSTRRSISPARSRSWSRSKGLPPEARIGTWVFEWYWKQPGVPHVAEFVADIRKAAAATCRPRAPGSAIPRSGRCKLAAEKAKSLDAVEAGQGAAGLGAAAGVALHAEQSVLLPQGRSPADADAFVGKAQPAPARRRSGRPVQGRPPWSGRPTAPAVEETGCKMTWPAE
jgi:branched-chain amino acid transport system substrate-binding protein